MSPNVCPINILNWIYNLPTEFKRWSNWNNPQLYVVVSSNSSIWEAETKKIIRNFRSTHSGLLINTKLFLKIKG